jgi:hypothetical protein
MANSTTLAIALAIKTNSIRLIERPSRLGGTFIAISDDSGIIEVANTLQEAEARIAEVVA